MAAALFARTTAILMSQFPLAFWRKAYALVNVSLVEMISQFELYLHSLCEEETNPAPVVSTTGTSNAGQWLLSVAVA